MSRSRETTRSFISFIIPYRESETHPRDRADECVEHIKQSVPTGAVIVAGSSGDDFSRAKALNFGIQMADGEYLAPMDVDLRLPEHFWRNVRPMLHPNAFLIFDFWEGGKPYHPGTPGGLNIFHRELYERSGGYCTEYEGYGYEDYDLRDRMKDCGADIVYTGIKIEHIPHPQVEGIHEQLKRNEMVYIRRTAGGE